MVWAAGHAYLRQPEGRRREPIDRDELLRRGYRGGRGEEPHETERTQAEVDFGGHGGKVEGSAQQRRRGRAEP